MSVPPRGRHSISVSIIRPFFVVGSLIVIFVALLGWCTCMPGRSFEGELPKLTPPQAALQQRLEGHVGLLAGPLVPRNHTDPERYEKARAYIREQLSALGAFEVSEQKVDGAAEPSYNVVAEIKGSAHPDEILVIGAHYDSHGTTPGADDNASGVAAGLEVARAFAARGKPPARTVRFVFYANEEPPYFKRESMGSLGDARIMASESKKIVMMFSLEMLGYYDTAKGSQKYPPVLRSFYPDTADFVAFVGQVKDRSLVKCSVRSFRELATFPSEGFAGPRFIEGLDYSDHWSYWEQGYPAIMVTDTSFFRNSHYHQLTDMPDTLDYPRFARVVDGLDDVLWLWAQAEGCTR